MTERETELCKSIGREMLKARHSIRNEDYEFNPEQKAKLDAIIEYATELANANGGTIERIANQTGDSVGAVEIRFIGEITFGDASASMEQFSKAIELCDGFDIFGTGLDDGSFTITFFVDNLSFPKSK